MNPAPVGVLDAAELEVVAIKGAMKSLLTEIRLI